jgi:hypothetical protein
MRQKTRTAIALMAASTLLAMTGCSKLPGTAATHVQSGVVIEQPPMPVGSNPPAPELVVGSTGQFIVPAIKVPVPSAPGSGPSAPELSKQQIAAAAQLSKGP